jgi:hypothetical protein
MYARKVRGATSQMECGRPARSNVRIADSAGHFANKSFRLESDTMKLLFRTPHLVEAQSLRDFLASACIESVLAHEHLSFHAEGAVATSAMPEVWVPDESFETALSVKTDWRTKDQDVTK